MNSLLQLAIKAHGGMDSWKKFEKISARLLCGGVLWQLKQQQGVVDDIYVTSDLKSQKTSHYPFIIEDWVTSFTPGRIAIENAEGEVIQELLNPRDSFAGHIVETPWSQLQLAYFAGYAMWNYFNAPFIFADPEYKAAELEPWLEGNEVYRRLQITFPDGIATHSKQQIFYIDKDGLIRRHDYSVDISGSAGAAHYLSDYIEVQGIMIATKRRVYVRQEDNTPLLPEPLLVSIDLKEITLQ